MARIGVEYGNEPAAWMVLLVVAIGWWLVTRDPNHNAPRNHDWRNPKDWEDE